MLCGGTVEQISSAVQARTALHQHTEEKRSLVQLLQTLSLCGFINR